MPRQPFSKEESSLVKEMWSNHARVKSIVNALESQLGSIRTREAVSGHARKVLKLKSHPSRHSKTTLKETGNGFTVRIDKKLMKKLDTARLAKGQSVRVFIENLLRKYLEGE